MIYIVSIILMFAFILSGIFAGLAPNVYRIIEKDFIRRAHQNARLEGLQYGDLGLRAKTFNAASDNPAERSREITAELSQENGVVYQKSSSNITVPQVTAQNPNTTIIVSVITE